MRLETDFTVAAPADRVWSELLDLDALAACLPGSELRRVNGAGTLQGALRPRVAGAELECVGTLKPVDVDEDGRSASWLLRARQIDAPGFATSTLRCHVQDAGGATRLSLSAEGRIASTEVSEGEARPEVERLLGELGSSLERSLSERASRPVAEAPGPETEPSGAPARPLAPAPRAPAPAPSPAAQLAAPAAAGAGAIALALALLARRKRRGAWVEIRYRW
jgi:carbon monoxide dehydrogenase subunit G